MRSMIKPWLTVVLAVPALALGVLAVPAAASAAPAEQPTPITEFFEGLPEAPAQCADWWDPIEDAIEENVDLDRVPKWAQESFEAFDEWCEAPAENAAEEAPKVDDGHSDAPKA